jgi:hypothetical protein
MRLQPEGPRLACWRNRRSGWLAVSRKTARRMSTFVHVRCFQGCVLAHAAILGILVDGAVLRRIQTSVQDCPKGPVGSLEWTDGAVAGGGRWAVLEAVEGGQQRLTVHNVHKMHNARGL